MGSIRGSIGSMLVGAEPALLVAEGMLIGWELRTASNVSSRSGFNLLGDVLIMLSSIGSSRPTSGISNSGFLVVVVVVVVEVVVVEAVVVGVVVVEAVEVEVVVVEVVVVKLWWWYVQRLQIQLANRAVKISEIWLHHTYYED